MDCKYIKEQDIHERYLLERLDESEKAEYREHLNSCDSCKNKLNSEKIALSSIRHFGKREMKSEIARQVADIKSRENNISWDMILKVAAVFFFLVITPGLIYYYQIIESPQVVEKQFSEETQLHPKVAETDESAEKSATNLQDLENKKEKKGNIDDLLGSGAGTASVPSIRPVGTSKSAKKSSPPVEETNEIAADEFIDVESEQIQPSAPKSTIPDIKNFYKPASSNQAEQEINKAKIASDVKTRAAAHSMNDVAKNERLLEIKLPSASPKESRNLLMDKSRESNIVKLKYNIENNSVLVNLIPQIEKPDFYFQETLPDSFAVIILDKDSSNLSLDWLVNTGLLQLNPDDILLSIGKNNNIFLNINKSNNYKISLDSDSTQAILIK